MPLDPLAVAALAAVCLALAFLSRRLRQNPPNPQTFLGAPSLPEDLTAAVLRFEKWKKEGRLSKEDYDRLMELCRQDALTKN